MVEVDVEEIRSIADAIDDSIAPINGESFWIFSEEQLIEFVRTIKAA